MINVKINNLKKSTSPYLQQHHDNPINWQEWSQEVLNYAKDHNKIILVSVGYATCHWCHVMAREAFSDKEIAEFLNEHFVCIKVDKEQRPDIDRFMMAFIQETQGHGGWPLNVFLTPEIKPLLAVTYVPVESKHGLPKFIDVISGVKEFFDQKKNQVQKFIPSDSHEETIEEMEIIQSIKHNHLHPGPQFPPHNTLLFLLSYYEKNQDEDLKEIIENLLDVIAKRGLHDHLQGGFYRYCVDEEWTIPHFEKMLYDQSMLLWVYSVAYKILKKPLYHTIIEKIVICLDETFFNHLYFSAHDADTNHHEGITYVWDKEELEQNLTESEYKQFQELYLIEKNFEGKIHLIKKNNHFIPKIEEKLLHIRKLREQPFTDQKFVTSWNALIGISFIQAYRSSRNEEYKFKAISLFKNLLEKHYENGILHHSSHKGQLQLGEFLEDYAAMLLFTTYIYEETGEYKEIVKKFNKKLHGFKQEGWIESKTSDFLQIQASTFDHPSPSSSSLAEMAQLRASIILEEEYDPTEYKSPFHHDFFNLMVFIKNGNWHIIHSPENIDWNLLPANCIQIRSDKTQDCYNLKCHEFKDIKELLESLK